MTDEGLPLPCVVTRVTLRADAGRRAALKSTPDHFDQPIKVVFVREALARPEGKGAPKDPLNFNFTKTWATKYEKRKVGMLENEGPGLNTGSPRPKLWWGGFGVGQDLVPLPLCSAPLQVAPLQVASNKCCANSL